MKELELKRKLKNMEGITLISLVITIIILLILATVSITLLINGGILDKAKSAVDKYSENEIEEHIKLAYQEYQIEKSSNGVNKNISEFLQEQLRITLADNKLFVTENEGTILVTLSSNKLYEYNINSDKIESTYVISKSTKKEDSYVGYYADIDENGIVDGVIFVDLLTGSIRETQQWGNQNGVYTLPNNISISNVKNYYISQNNYTDSHFGSHPVISPKGNVGENRFFIMSLNDLPGGKYYWYKNADGNMDDYLTTTSIEFGKGKSNTLAMINKWNNSLYGEQNERDLWNHIQTKYAEGWFVPSKEEWAAFGNEIGLTKDNYQSTFGFSAIRWSSSQMSEKYPYIAFLQAGSIGGREIYDAREVRLATTF